MTYFLDIEGSIHYVGFAPSKAAENEIKNPQQGRNRVDVLLGKMNESRRLSASWPLEYLDTYLVLKSMSRLMQHGLF